MGDNAPRGPGRRSTCSLGPFTHKRATFQIDVSPVHPPPWSLLTSWSCDRNSSHCSSLWVEGGVVHGRCVEVGIRGSWPPPSCCCVTTTLVATSHQLSEPQLSHMSSGYLTRPAPHLTVNVKTKHSALSDDAFKTYVPFQGKIPLLLLQ